MRYFASLLSAGACLLLCACSDRSNEQRIDPALLGSNESPMQDGVWSGVPFTVAEQVAVLDLANRATLQVLDVDVALTSTAAANIVAARPIASLQALDDVPQVGPAALQALKAYLPTWTGQGNPDARLLEFVNHPSVTVEELDNIQYIGPAHAQGIVQYRQLDPIDSLDELLAASASAGASPLAPYQVESLRSYAGRWQPPAGGTPTHQPGTWYGVTFSGFEVGVVLDIVNHASLEVLDDEVGLVSTAARNIVDRRPIDSMDALAAVPYVATLAFQRLKAWIPNWTPTDPDPGGQPQPDPGEPMIVSGVHFSAAEIQATLDLVNRASAEYLNKTVGLDTRAANNIVAARPIAGMTELDAVPYVAVTALEKLKAHVPAWLAANPSQPEPQPSGGTHDGVVFSAAEESAALEISNLATATQLTEGGIATTPRNILLNNRPWANLAAVAAYAGIGPATMTSLKAMVPGWRGPVDQPARLTLQQLVDEATARGVSSPYYGKPVQVARAIITSAPSTSSAGNTNFMVADPAAGNARQLKVYIAATALQNLAFASLFDDVQLVGVFDQYSGTFQLKLDDPATHRIALNVSGVPYPDFKTIQAAWRSTAANPEGAVRLVSSFGYTYMVPLPVFMDHPMYGGTRPAPPQDSGNEQDLAWNAAAQHTLSAWLGQ